MDRIQSKWCVVRTPVAWYRGYVARPVAFCRVCNLCVGLTNRSKVTHRFSIARSTAPPGYLLPSTVYLHVHNPLLYLRTQYRLSEDERYKSVGSSYAPISFCDKFFTFYPKLVLIEINAGLRSREGHASAPIIEAVVSINFPLVSRLTNRNFYFRLRG